jgi:hypothetical protein
MTLFSNRSPAPPSSAPPPPPWVSSATPPSPTAKTKETTKFANTTVPSPSRFESGQAAGVRPFFSICRPARKSSFVEVLPAIC